jgi:hypothetical protein
VHLKSLDCSRLGGAYVKRLWMLGTNSLRATFSSLCRCSGEPAAQTRRRPMFVGSCFRAMPTLAA